MTSPAFQIVLKVNSRQILPMKNIKNRFYFNVAKPKCAQVGGEPHICGYAASTSITQSSPTL